MKILKFVKSRAAVLAALTLIVLASSIVISSCGSFPEQQLLVIKRPGLPVVYYRVMINAGSALDPEDKPGLAYFTAQLLNKGTRNRSRADIERELDQLGATLSISVDKEVVVISGRTLAENSGAFYSIFSEILTQPVFPESEIDPAIKDQLFEIGQLRSDDASLSLAVFENTIFEGHRYGHAVEGTESAVSSFSRTDAVNFYRSNYRQGNILAAIGGAVEDSLVERFRADLGMLPSGKTQRSEVQVHVGESPRVVLVEKENRTQSHLRVGHVLRDNRTSPQYHPMRVLGCYLGQHREAFGRLYKNIRADRGLAYGAYAYTEYFRPQGWSKMMNNGIVRNNQYFHMWTYPKESNFEFCIKLMLDEMNRLRTNPLTAGEVNQTEDYITNNFAFAIETTDQQLGMQLDEMWYETPKFIEDFKAKIKRVSRSEIQTVALDNLSPDGIVIVAVVSDGNSSKQELLTMDTKLELPSGAEEGELKAANDEIKSLDLKLKPENITIVKASEMFK